MEGVAEVNSPKLQQQLLTQHLDTAVELARRGVRGANPLVGAVIVDDDGAVVATGYHQGAGTPHAEAAALQNLQGYLQENLRHSPPLDPASLTMLVTLEPCNHTGRTGPCSQAIINAGIGHVVYAVADETAAAAGGAYTLRNAGIKVTHMPEHRGAAQLNPRWNVAQQQNRPFVSLKIAQSLDGKIAAADGSSQWITSAQAREHAHTIRAQVDAVVVGTGTVLADNPTLNARTPDGTLAPHQPERIIMGQRTIPQDATIFTSDGGPTTQIFSRDPHAVLAELAAKNVGHVLIEGGSHIAAAFLSAGVVDEIHLYQAPLLIGDGKTSVPTTGTGTLAQAWERHSYRYDPVGTCLDTGTGTGVLHLGPDILVHLEATNTTFATTKEMR